MESNLFSSYDALLVSVLRSTPNHTPLKYRCSFKMSDQIRPAYLNGGRLLQLIMSSVSNSALSWRRVGEMDRFDFLVLPFTVLNITCAHHEDTCSHVFFF
jgi:hypothetical protein